MIRINLLEETKSRAPAVFAGPSVPSENLAIYVGQAAVVILALLVSVGWYWRNTQTIDQLNEDIKKEEKELERLRAVIELNNKLEKKRDLLRRKIEVISRLKRNQDVPVQMLDHLSRNLSEFLWLESLRVKGRTLELQGKCAQEYAYAQFMRNLQNSPYFDDIRPKTIQQSRGVYDWVLDVTFVLPDEKEEEGTQRASAGR